MFGLSGVGIARGGGCGRSSFHRDSRCGKIFLSPLTEVWWKLTFFPTSRPITVARSMGRAFLGLAVWVGTPLRSPGGQDCTRISRLSTRPSLENHSMGKKGGNNICRSSHRIEGGYYGKPPCHRWYGPNNYSSPGFI